MERRHYEVGGLAYEADSVTRAKGVEAVEGCPGSIGPGKAQYISSRI